jgi:hypothetical protein
MQHMWYEVRSGDAYQAAGQLPKALKKYTSVAKHFSGEGTSQGGVLEAGEGGLLQSAASAVSRGGLRVCRTGQTSLPSSRPRAACLSVHVSLPAPTSHVLLLSCTHHPHALLPCCPAALLSAPPYSQQTSLRTSLTFTATVCASSPCAPTWACCGWRTGCTITPST